ncbi:hypothetical protein IU474_31540 [Nocardia otitidiscaviarum]|uniref:WXG100-like domain-containing protein n=1 Tax=Nocardia otitidiscaviarum TaxID=1823 RepID=UPI00189568FE|nr:hypothetical protein [Nocardia otitidiscaviarum]MBF6241579.1 hypothetical protein [Nocardia otitidiscaviarum]
MAIQIPSEVALFLNFLGFPYPDINEDHVRELADQVRTFAEKVRNTHTAATGTINDMGSVYSGYSYEQLVTTWARMSATNMADLDQACTVVATALDAAAVVIVSVKIAVLTELAALAVAYATAMSAAVATSGLSATMGPAIAAAARRLLVAMEQTLLSYLLAEVIGRAVEPLEETVARVVNGFAYESARRALGVPSEAGPTQTLHIDPDEVLRYAKVLDDHAADITRHAQDFANNVAGLDFTTPDGGLGDRAGIPRTWTSPDPGANAGVPDPNPAGDPRYSGSPAVTASPAAVAAPAAWQAASGPGEPSGTSPLESAASPASESRMQPPPPSTPDGTSRTEQTTDGARQQSAAPDRSGTGTPGQPAAADSGGTPGRLSDQPSGDTSAPTRAIPGSSDPVGQRPDAEPRSDRQHDIRSADSTTAGAASDSAVPRSVGSLSDTTTFTSPLASATASTAASASGDAQRTGSGTGNLAPSAGASPGRPPKTTPWTRTAKPVGPSTTPPEPDLVSAAGSTQPQPERAPITTPWSRTRPATDVPSRVAVPANTRPAPKVALPGDATDPPRTDPPPATPSVVAARPVATAPDHEAPAIPNREAEAAESAAPARPANSTGSADSTGPGASTALPETDTAGPAIPRETAGPGGPDGHTGPDGHAEPGDSAEPTEPRESRGAAGPSGPAGLPGPAGPGVVGSPRRPGGITAPDIGPPQSV